MTLGNTRKTHQTAQDGVLVTPSTGKCSAENTTLKQKARNEEGSPSQPPVTTGELVEHEKVAKRTGEELPISFHIHGKRNRTDVKTPQELPFEYEQCEVRDLVQVICEMLMELIHINDQLPLQDGGLTRFHSRAPPSISVTDYLQRLATHATLSAPILLSMIYYIDKLCALYPAFTISSLTVHRFLIASATVASKGLSDAFWTNGTYARVGGVSIRELGLLELELLWRIDWRIVPQPEILVQYYQSLVARSKGFCLGTLDS